MQSTTNPNKTFLIGIKFISFLMGAISFLCLSVALLRIFAKNKFPQNEPGELMIGFMVVMTIYFAWLSIGLWKLTNRARVATLITVALIFVLLTANLIQHHIFPNFKSWWHYYLYPIIIIYLLLPSTRQRFKASKTKT